MTVSRTLTQTRDAFTMSLKSTVADLGLVIAFVVIFPLGFLFFLGLIVQPALRPQVLVGSLMMEFALLNINVLAQSIGGDKRTRIYDLWVSLPISPVVYVVSTALALLPFSLLSAGVTIAIGVLFFGIAVPLGDFGLLLAALLLVWLSTIGIGFLIGVYGRNPRQINSVAQFVGIVMTFFAPVFYPVTALPSLLQYIAYAWPVTWGAILLHSVLVNGVLEGGVAAGVLAAFTVGWLILIRVGLRWRRV